MYLRTEKYPENYPYCISLFHSILLIISFTFDGNVKKMLLLFLHDADEVKCD